MAERRGTEVSKWVVAVYLVLLSHSPNEAWLMTSSCLTWWCQTLLYILCYLLPSKLTGQLPPRNLAVSGPGILHLRGGHVLVSLTAMPVKLL